MALSALTDGGTWVADSVAALGANRATLAAALAPLQAAAEAEAEAGRSSGGGATTTTSSSSSSSSGGGGEGAVARGVFGGEGAIYFWARLPRGFEALDEEVVAWLIREHGVCVIPGSACGCPGHIRAAFANLTAGSCAEAAGRLRRGLEALVAGGPSVLAVRAG